MFDKINADYQITANAEDIDIIRIIRENNKSNCIFVATDNNFMVLSKKEFSKDINENLLYRISPECVYGFHGTNNEVSGDMVISNGFTHICFYEIDKYDYIFSTFSNAKLAKEKRIEDLKNMEVVKVSTI